MSHIQIEVDYGIQVPITFKGEEIWAIRLKSHGALEVYPTEDAALWQIATEKVKNARVARRTRTIVTSDWEPVKSACDTP